MDQLVEAARMRTCRRMVIADRLHHRCYFGAIGLGNRTPGSESAAARLGHGTGHIALENPPFFPFQVGIRSGNRTQQRPCVRVRRIRENLFGSANLSQVAQIHDGHPV